MNCTICESRLAVQWSDTHGVGGVWSASIDSPWPFMAGFVAFCYFPIQRTGKSGGTSL